MIMFVLLVLGIKTATFCHKRTKSKINSYLAFFGAYFGLLLIFVYASDWKISWNKAIFRVFGHPVVSSSYFQFNLISLGTWICAIHRFNVTTEHVMSVKLNIVPKSTQYRTYTTLDWLVAKISDSAQLNATRFNSAFSVRANNMQMLLFCRI